MIASRVSGRRTNALAAVLMMVALGGPAGRLVAQQSLAARVAAVRTGAVQFEFAARDGVCGDGRSYIRAGGSMIGASNFSANSANCQPGPVRVLLQLSEARITSLREFAGPVPPPKSGVTELGEVSPAEGARYLLALAESDDGRVANRAVFPAVLGRDVVAWPALLRIARAERGGGRRGKHDVTFWLAQYAAAKLAGSDNPFAANDDRDPGGEETLKEHAVFALSQLRNGEGIEPLIQVARTNRNAAVRAKAMFWLGESGDRRALDLFEQVLTTGAATPHG